MTEIALAEVDLSTLLATGSGTWHASAVQDEVFSVATLTADDRGGWSAQVVLCRSGQTPSKNSGCGYFRPDVIPYLLRTLGFDAADSVKWKRAETSRVTRLVYFIQADNGLIKIGASDEPASRFAQIRTMSPVPLRLLGVIPDAGDARETELHQRFASDRTHGEWFRSSPDLLDYITTNAVTRGTHE